MEVVERFSDNVLGAQVAAFRRRATDRALPSRAAGMQSDTSFTLGACAASTLLKKMSRAQGGHG